MIGPTPLAPEATPWRSRWRWIWPLVFVGPAFLAVLLTTLLPAALTVWLSGTDWDLRRHNRFQGGRGLSSTGLASYQELLTDGRVGAIEEAGRTIGMVEAAADSDLGGALMQTLFQLGSVPVGVTLSLVLAMLLRGDLDGRRIKRGRRNLVIGTVITAAVLLMLGAGLTTTGTLFVIVTLAMLIMLGGVTLGRTFYQGLLFLPYVFAGAAGLTIWRSLARQDSGPLDQLVAPFLQAVQTAAAGAPQLLVAPLPWLAGLIMLGVLTLTLRPLKRAVRYREAGVGAIACGLAIALSPTPICLVLGFGDPFRTSAMAGFSVALLTVILGPPTLGALRRQSLQRVGVQLFDEAGLLIPRAALGAGAQLAMLMLAYTMEQAPTLSGDVPRWIRDPGWARPVLAGFALWTSVGALSLVVLLTALDEADTGPAEAAALDGATWADRFWYTVWPQIRPTFGLVLAASLLLSLHGQLDCVAEFWVRGTFLYAATLPLLTYGNAFTLGELSIASAGCVLLTAASIPVWLYLRNAQRHAAS